MMVLHKEEEKEQSSGSNSLSTSIIPTAAGEGEDAAASHNQTTDHRNSDASHDQSFLFSILRCRAIIFHGVSLFFSFFSFFFFLVNFNFLNFLAHLLCQMR
ncbi:hypothetical protein C1H46_039196 [Malus baccata]|uniref:Uncharacterized protein n=1 Tax=Malus baccata TaxID=106549 RepID=A0A540KM51_MALBA|nr:hypothetical protein C1H46_039196 [Malus baccata]